MLLTLFLFGVLVVLAQSSVIAQFISGARLQFPQDDVQFCLETGGIRGKDVDYVAFFEKRFENSIRF